MNDKKDENYEDKGEKGGMAQVNIQEWTDKDNPLTLLREFFNQTQSREEVN